MAEAKAKKPNQKAGNKPVLFADLKKFGTQAQQIELSNFLGALTKEQVQTVQSLIERMSTGACIKGDGTIDPTTGALTTGGYRKSVHYIKAYFANRPMPVEL